MNTSRIAFYSNADDGRLLTPADAIMSMFEHTDENGTLYIPEWPYDQYSDGKERFYQCAMNWSESDAKNVVAEYSCLHAALEKLAERLDSLGPDPAPEALPAELRDVWNTYLRDFETGDIDAELAMDVFDRLDTVHMIADIAGKLKNGEEISQDEAGLYDAFKDTVITEKEMATCQAYKDAIHADAEKRIGKSPAAYDVVIRARRLCKLMAIHAPQIIIDNEADLLAQAMAIHGYCRERKTVDDVE